jgi:hypothetical protein
MGRFRRASDPSQGRECRTAPRVRRLVSQARTAQRDGDVRSAPTPRPDATTAFARRDGLGTLGPDGRYGRQAGARRGRRWTLSLDRTRERGESSPRAPEVRAQPERARGLRGLPLSPIEVLARRTRRASTGGRRVLLARASRRRESANRSTPACPQREALARGPTRLLLRRDRLQGGCKHAGRETVVSDRRACGRSSRVDACSSSRAARIPTPTSAVALMAGCLLGAVVCKHPCLVAVRRSRGVWPGRRIRLWRSAQVVRDMRPRPSSAPSGQLPADACV